MPIGLNQTDRKLLLGLGMALLVAFVVLAYLHEDDDVEAPFPSTYSVRSGGAKATFILLEQLRYDVQRWDKSPTQLPQESAGVLLIIASPQRAAEVHERKAIADFVKKGGTLLVTGATAGNVLTESGVQANPVDLEVSWKSYTALVPHPVTRSAPSVTMPDRSQWWTEAHTAVPLYGIQGKVGAVEMTTEKGRIFWIGSSVPLSNAGLKAAGNVEFLQAVLQTTATRKVLWDTYFTEQERKASDFKLTSATLWGGAQLLLVMLCGMWTFSRRQGPVRALPVVSRLSPIEFVEALGNLYQRRKATNLTVDVALRRFRFALSRRLGLPATADVARLADRGAALAGLSVPEVEQVLRQCETARFDPDLGADVALQLTRQLGEFAHKMRLTKKQ